MAEKYGISETTLVKKANAEKWRALRTEAERKSAIKAQQKVAEASAANATIAADLKKRLLLRLQRIENNYPLDATEIRQKEGESYTVYRIKDLTAAYKDLADDIPKGSDPTDQANANSLISAIMTAATAQEPMSDVPENVGEPE